MLIRPTQGTWQPRAEGYVIEPLDPAFRPVQTSTTRTKRVDGVVREIDLGGRRAKFDAENGARVTAVLDQVDGLRTTQEIAARCGTDLDETLEIVQQLYHFAVLGNGGDTMVPAMAFQQHADNLFRAKRARVVEEVPEFGRTERPAPRMYLGILLEQYHYVMSAPTHVGPAVTAAPNERIRMMFSEYLSNEYWHGLALREGLLAAGLSARDIERTDPLIGTLGVINHMRNLAGTDVLSYSACMTGAEMGDTSDVARTIRRYEQFIEGGLPEAAVSPFREHELEDAGANHQALGAEAFADSPPLTKALQDQIRRQLLLFYECWIEQQRHIWRFYGAPEGPRYFSVG